MNWREDIFDHFVRLKRGFDLPEANLEPGPFPVVASTSITAHHKEYRVKGPGVVTGRSGSLGSVQYVQGDYWPHNTALYVKDFRGNYPKFAFYVLQKMHLENFNSGAGVPTLNQNHLHKLKIRIPSVQIQKKIAAVLSAYDELIESNRRYIALLEKLAEEIYREWFVRLRFPGHKNVKRNKRVPDGWQVVELKTISSEVGTSTKPGGHLANRFYLPLELLNMKQMIPAGHMSYTEAQSSLVTFEKGDFLFGAMRPYQHKVAIAPFAGITRTTCFVIRPRLPEAWSWLFLTLFQEFSVDFATNICNGSDRPYAVWNKAMERMKLLRPTDALLKRFENIARPILDSIVGMYFIQSKLVAARDMVLPRLISGKLSVQNLDIQFPPGMADELNAEQGLAPSKKVKS